MPCDSLGAPADLSDPSWAAPEAGLSRRDASAFLRGMRRFARVDRLDKICSDAGPTIATAPAEARYALYYSVYTACTAALAAAESQGLEPKDAQVRGRPPASDFATSDATALRCMRAWTGQLVAFLLLAVRRR